MKTHLSTLFLVSFLLISAPVAAVIPLTDPGQDPQVVLKLIQTNATSIQQKADTVNALRKRATSGLYGLRRFTDLDSLKRLGEFKVTSFVDAQLNDIFGNDTFSNVFGDGLVNQLNVNDLSNINLDTLKQLGIAQASSLTQQQMKEILGKDLANKLSEQQMRSLLNDPKRLINFLSSSKTTVQQASDSNRQVLAILGTKSDVFKKTTATAVPVTPSGNRSDAFGGTGNGSTPQTKEALEAFKAIKTDIEQKAQMPVGEEFKKITAQKMAEIRNTQNLLQRETSLMGLATAWLRQTLMTRKMPEQEQEAASLYSKAKDEREIIRSISYITLMGVEAQNGAADIFAEDLKVVSAQANIHVGSLSKDIVEPAKTTEESTDTKSQTTTPQQSGTQGTTSTEQSGDNKTQSTDATTQNQQTGTAG